MCRTDLSSGQISILGEPRSNPIPQNTLIQMLLRNRDYRDLSEERIASLRGYRGRWGGSGYVKISHDGCAINYANLSLSPGEKGLTHF